MSNCFYATHNIDSHTMKATRYDHISCSHHRLLLYLNLLLLLLYGRVLLFPEKIRHFSWEVLGNQFEFAAIQSIDIDRHGMVR
jgi:hypothetical protein